MSAYDRSVPLWYLLSEARVQRGLSCFLGLLMLIAYLNEFGHIGPYISRTHTKHNDSPVCGLAGFNGYGYFLHGSRAAPNKTYLSSSDVPVIPNSSTHSYHYPITNTPAYE